MHNPSNCLVSADIQSRHVNDNKMFTSLKNYFFRTHYKLVRHDKRVATCSRKVFHIFIEDIEVE